jgi:hypothetical protein
VSAKLCDPTCRSIEPISNTPDSPIYTLNDDVLLNVFHIYRLAHPDEYGDEEGEFRYAWDGGTVQTSACLSTVADPGSYHDFTISSVPKSRLHIRCSTVPVADMLTYPPSLPYPDATTDDESGIFLAPGTVIA